MENKESYQAIKVLREIRDAFIQIQNPTNFKSMVEFLGANQNAAIRCREKIRNNITDSHIKDIALSNDDCTIKEFFDLLEQSKKITMLQNEFVEISNQFCDYLPTTSLVAVKIKIKQTEAELERIKISEKHDRDVIKYQLDISVANIEMDKIKNFHLFRSKEKKMRQINEQQRKIDEINIKAAEEKQKKIKRLEDTLIQLNSMR